MGICTRKLNFFRQRMEKDKEHAVTYGLQITEHSISSRLQIESRFTVCGRSQSFMCSGRPTEPGTARSSNLTKRKLPPPSMIAM